MPRHDPQFDPETGEHRDVYSGRPTGWLTMQQAADRIGVPLSTLKYWRWKRLPGPTGHQYGRRVMYRPEAVDVFIASRAEGAAETTEEARS